MAPFVALVLSTSLLVVGGGDRRAAVTVTTSARPLTPTRSSSAEISAHSTSTPTTESRVQTSKKNVTNKKTSKKKGRFTSRGGPKSIGGRLLRHGRGIGRIASGFRDHFRDDPCVVADDERVVLFPTAARRIVGADDAGLDSSSPNSKGVATWKVPIHGWVFEPEEGSKRRKAFMALLRSGLDLNGDREKRKKRKVRDKVARNHIKKARIDKLGSEQIDSRSVTNTKIVRLDQDDHAGEDYTDDDVGDIEQAAVAGTRSSREILDRRLLPFIVDNERGKRLSIRIADTIYRLPVPSAKNGHFRTVLRLTDDEAKQGVSWRSGDKKGGSNMRGSPDILRYEVVTSGCDEENDECVSDDSTPTYSGVSYLIPPSGGLSVVSDIDDTVKVSHVLDKKRLIRKTFLEEFEAVPGMAKLYQSWAERAADDGGVCSFHFVSSSPWQLYEEISSFLSREGFPKATFHLRSIRLKDRTLLNLFADPMASKVRVIESILRGYPKRDFVLVGDTGERDPEVYGELARRHPDQILAVYLREVLPPDAKKKDFIKSFSNGDGNGDIDSSVVDNFEWYWQERFRVAFDGVPGHIWSIFNDPSKVCLPSSVRPSDDSRVE